MAIAQKYLPNYTYADYCQWEGQWELIEGIPYAMSPLPIIIHQIVNGNLYTNFKICQQNINNVLKTRYPEHDLLVVLIVFNIKKGFYFNSLVCYKNKITIAKFSFPLVVCVFVLV